MIFLLINQSIHLIKQITVQTTYTIVSQGVTETPYFRYYLVRAHIVLNCD